MMDSISVIVPLYNEGDGAARAVAHLRRVRGLDEAVLVDASDAPHSRAAIAALARELELERERHNENESENDSRLRIHLITDAQRGRAAQMNAGAAVARGDALLFLHCDTRLPPDAAQRIRACLAHGHLWGWFDLALDARGAAYRVIERMINLRARASRIATGDQAMFIARRVFEQQRGFAAIALMEDIEMSRRLKRLGSPARIARPALTSARRWRRHGLARTVWLMWKLRFLYWRGARPDALAARYHDAR